MAKNKITQKELAFYLLYKSRKEDQLKFVKVWQFVGEMEIIELKTWGLMSYTCPHRIFEVYQENPGLVEREKTTGKTGARYYQYRLALNVNIDLIKDPVLLAFYKRLKHANTT